MKYIGNVSSIMVNDDFEIGSIYQFEEDGGKVMIKTYEFVPEFVRGFMCDVKVKFEVLNENDDKNQGEKYMATYLEDLLLIRVNKCSSADGITLFDYVFLKH